VYQETGASVRATYRGWIGDGVLAVRNADPDNFGLYGGDNLDDGWQVQFFGLDSPQAAPARDPDSDGTNNLLEFAFGSNPCVGETPPALTIGRLEGDHLTITFPRRKDVADLTYVVEVSSDLETWDCGPIHTEEVAAVDIDATFELVTVRDLTPLSAVPHRFIRIRINTLP
jgi:hypothetical protein